MNKMKAELRSAFRIKGTIPTKLYIAIAISAFALLLAVWMGAAYANIFSKTFLPSPLDVAVRFKQWLMTGDLLVDASISIFRVSAGFLIAAVMAVPLSLFIATFRPIQAFFEPFIEFVRYIPAVAFVPLVLLWVGIDEASKITIIWIGTFFQMILMLSEDVRRVPMAQIEAGQTMGATGGEVLTRILFRSALPNMMDTLRITLGWAWTFLVVAELVAANTGVGYAILKAQRFLQTDKIFAGMLLIGVLGLVMDQSFRFLHRRMFPWLYG